MVVGVDICVVEVKLFSETPLVGEVQVIFIV